MVILFYLSDRYENSNEFSFDCFFSKQFEPYLVYLYSLRQSFDKLCQKYIDVVLDKDGMYSVIDSVCDQPIFFLIAQAEDFPDINRSQKKVEICNEENIVKDMKACNVDDNVENLNENKNKKSFTFSDFINLTAENYESDNENNTSKTEENDVVADCKENLASVEVSETVSVDDVESVYMMASSRSIDSVVEEYMKRKKSCSMLPAIGHFSKRKNSVSAYNNSVGIIEPLPPEIEQQRKTSINKVNAFLISL